MTTMVRKQIYIPRRQDILIKRLSETKGLSEAEIIRQAIEREISGSMSQSPSDNDAWAKLMEAVEEVRQRWDGKREPLRWTREEIYAEREDRWLKNQEGQ